MKKPQEETETISDKHNKDCSEEGTVRIRYSYPFATVASLAFKKKKKKSDIKNSNFSFIYWHTFHDYIKQKITIRNFWIIKKAKLATLHCMTVFYSLGNVLIIKEMKLWSFIIL